MSDDKVAYVFVEGKLAGSFEVVRDYNIQADSGAIGDAIAERVDDGYLDIFVSNVANPSQVFHIRKAVGLGEEAGRLIDLRRQFLEGKLDRLQLRFSPCEPAPCPDPLPSPRPFRIVTMDDGSPKPEQLVRKEVPVEPKPRTPAAHVSFDSELFYKILRGEDGRFRLIEIGRETTKEEEGQPMRIDQRLTCSHPEGLIVSGHPFSYEAIFGDLPKGGKDRPVYSIFLADRIPNVGLQGAVDAILNKLNHFFPAASDMMVLERNERGLPSLVFVTYRGGDYSGHLVRDRWSVYRIVVEEDRKTQRVLIRFVDEGGPSGEKTLPFMEEQARRLEFESSLLSLREQVMRTGSESSAMAAAKAARASFLRGFVDSERKNTNTQDRYDKLAHYYVRQIGFWEIWDNNGDLEYLYGMTLDDDSGLAGNTLRACVMDKGMPEVAKRLSENFGGMVAEGTSTFRQQHNDLVAIFDNADHRCDQE